ncbi:hypothetical protein CF392_15060 [Tamilnaduibacter salinus]|uniref:Uncharacterized protein n=1 Tax=Tamilnaduibacter salinus TaxID=1484056 RepID=A0A2A2HZ94_9GAMM|nr:hypothetical protein CF392_15060 [Tamilnaduibacter salinus]
MADVQGQGLGIVLDDFKFAHGTDVDNGRIFRIGGIKSSAGEDVEIVVNQLYISGSGSNYGQNLSPVNLGRLTNPFSIDLEDGDNIGIPGKAVLSVNAPSKVSAADGFSCLDAGAGAGSGTCSSRPSGANRLGERPDVGLQLNVKVGDNQSSNLNVHAKSAVIDGSHIRLWGDDDRQQLVGQFKLNFYTPELSINACEQDGSDCGSRIKMTNFALELALGNKLQPMYLDVDGSGNFVAEIETIRRPAQGAIAQDGTRQNSNKAEWDFYEDYYTNPDYRSNLRIGNFSVGDRDFGSARVEGMLIQHLKIDTHDLAP